MTREDAIKLLEPYIDNDCYTDKFRDTCRMAIAAMQEAGSKLDRDANKGAYRAYRKVVLLVIELIRQFYDIPRQFRILGENGAEAFTEYSNAGIQTQNVPMMDGSVGLRTPLFDVEITAQKASPYSRLGQNELALQLYGAGFFNPAKADQALMAIELMVFEGKDKVKEMIQRNQQKFMLQQMIAMQANGGHVNGGRQAVPAAEGGEKQGSSIPADNGIAGAVRNATTSYAQQMAQRAQARVQG